MQTGRLLSADEQIMANGAAEAAQTEVLKHIINENDRRFEEVRTSTEKTGEEILGSIEESRNTLAQRLQQQDDFSHRENVCVYRNVQASMITELEKQTKELKEEISLLMEKLEKVEQAGAERKKIHSPLLWITFLLAAAGVTIQVLDFTGILDILIRMGNAVFFH